MASVSSLQSDVIQVKPLNYQPRKCCCSKKMIYRVAQRK